MSSTVLSGNLSRLMSDAALSASELGRRVDLPAATIKKLRTGENANPTITTLLPIANYFKVSVSQLIGEHKISETNGGVKVVCSDNQLDLLKVPLISWEDSITWGAAGAHNKEINQFTPQNSYALQIDSDDYDIFQEGGICIVDPNKSCKHKDYILALAPGQTRPSIRKYLEDAGNAYVQSIMKELNVTIPITQDYKILGIITNYMKWFI